MGSRRCLIQAAVLCTAASCSSSSSSASPRSCKPEAPVELQLDAVPDGAGAFALRLRATPTAEVASIELAVIAPDGRWLRAAPGAHALDARIDHDGRPAKIAGLATVVLDGVTMRRTVEVAIGPPKPPPVTRTYTLPDGERAREVRP